MKTAVLYIRVSTDEQASKGYSERYQHEVLCKYCQSNSLTIQQVIFEDSSAKTFNRPAWKAMLSDFKNKSKRPDYLLFIKWDRFSRNAADAYQMIRILNNYNIDPQAIEQRLDLSIPENKMMLAFYLAAPEVENDRRALNVFHGMRRARKEGRWMGTAPLGYINRATDNGSKYICPVEPQANIMKWALLEIGEGKYNTEQIWKEAKKKGLACSSSNFRQLIRNPIYCGKISISQFEDEPAYLVDGQHTAIISEEEFMKAQEALDNRKQKRITKQFTVPAQLVLRGFLICPKCLRMLTGSASTGSYSRYYYYHCQAPCRYRKSADLINSMFLEELIQWKPRLEFTVLFKSILKVRYESKMGLKIDRRNNALKELQVEQSKLARALDLLLCENLTVENFREVKISCEKKIEDLKYAVETTPDYIEKFGLSIHHKGNSLMRLYDFFKLASTQDQRKLIGLISPVNFVFNGTSFDIKEYGLAIKLIYSC